MVSELTPDETGGLLFDWDGTLADTQHANYRAMSAALASEPVQFDRDWFNARTGLSSAEMIEALAVEQRVRLTRSLKEIVAERDEFFLRQCHLVKTHALIEQVVDAHRGKVPMAVASGGARHVIEATLRHLPIVGSFDTLVTREDVERGKPHPDIFLLAAERLGVDPRNCTVYEDSDEGVAAARAARMVVIDVRPFTGRSAHR